MNKCSNILVILLTIASLFGSPLPIGSAVPPIFFYFNPDSPQGNLARLKETMDHALVSANLPLQFQAFAKYRDFDRSLREQTPGFLFMPEWFLKQDGNSDRFVPLLTPIRHGVTTYRKVLLVAADSLLTLADLSRATIAMTPMGPAGLDSLNQAIFKKNGLDAHGLNFLTTAKDSDALFALVLKQVQAALVSEDNLDQISRINPNILTKIKKLSISGPLPLPLLCCDKENARGEDIEKIKALFLSAEKDKNTKKIMEMLQIDAWQTTH